MKTQIVKAPVSMVFPLAGSPDDSKNRRIRVSAKQPYTLALVGFRLTLEQAIGTATALLTQAQQAQESGVKNTVLDVLARRKEGPGVISVQTAIAEPEKKKRAKPATNGSAQHATESAPAPKKTRKRTKKASAPASSQEKTATGATSEAA